jgi:predicted PurR-regulated permease PerM
MTERRAFLVVLALLLVVLWAARSVLAPFIVAGGLAYAFSPLVTAAHLRTRWPRGLIVVLAYAVLGAAVAALVIVSSGRIGTELRALSAAGPDLVASALRELLHADSITVLGTTLSVSSIADAVRASIEGVVASPGSAIHIAEVVVDLALQSILVLIVTFYLIVDGARVQAFVLDLVPTVDRGRTEEVMGHVHATLSRWLRGQLLLIALVAVVVYAFLGPVLHVPYAIAISLLTGILEIIPLVGPVIAAVIAMVAALVSGGTGTAIVVGVGYFVLRQVEDQLVMPIVVGRAVHLHPVVTIFAVLAGLAIYGVLGGLLGVPIAAAINVVFTDLYANRRGGATETAPVAPGPADGVDAPQTGPDEADPAA